MVRRWRVLVLSSVFVFLLSVQAFAVKINAQAPDFVLKDLQGNNVCLASFKGKVVILNFWSVNCAPCVAEIPSLSEVYREMKGDGLVVLGIALDRSDKPVRDLTARLKVEYPNLLDGNQDVYFDSYGLFGQPVSVIVDRGGLVREKIIGGVDWTSAKMKGKLQSYLKGR